MMKINNGMLALAGVAAVMATACGKSNSNASSDTTAMRTDSAAAASSMTHTDSMAGDSSHARPDSLASASGGMTDANIFYVLDQANVADSSEGALAAIKGTSSEVREYGQTMMKDHHAMRRDGQDLAKKLGITPMAPTGDQSATEMSAAMAGLQTTAKGPAWDKTYIDDQVSDHQKVLAKATNAASQAQNQELKDLLSKATPKVQAHLDRALALQRKMTAAM